MRRSELEYFTKHQTQDWEGLSIPTWASGRSSVPAKSDYLLKRPFDVAVGLIGLAISSPLWLVFALAIKLEDRGPLFFLQERWGKDKSKIVVYKFRTMVPHALERFGNIQAQENDPRVTRIGRLLRATSLDEMPQLLNIVRGDMSWVGPRALAIDEVQVVGENADLPDEAVPGFEDRSKLRPGLTGIAQIFAPRDVPREEKYRYDAVYARNLSLRLDLRLIFLSLWITLRARWEARERKF